MCRYGSTARGAPCGPQDASSAEDTQASCRPRSRRRRSRSSAAWMRPGTRPSCGRGQRCSSSPAQARAATCSANGIAQARARVCSGAAASPCSSNCSASSPITTLFAGAGVYRRTRLHRHAGDAFGKRLQRADRLRRDRRRLSRLASNAGSARGQQRPRRRQRVAARCPADAGDAPAPSPAVPRPTTPSLASPGRGSLPPHAASVSSCRSANHATRRFALRRAARRLRRRAIPASARATCRGNRPAPADRSRIQRRGHRGRHAARSSSVVGDSIIVALPRRRIVLVEAIAPQRHDRRHAGGARGDDVALVVADVDAVARRRRPAPARHAAAATDRACAPAACRRRPAPRSARPSRAAAAVAAPGIRACW